MAETPAPRSPFEALRRATSARVALGRAGQGLPTAPMLAFQLAHARASDAVHAPFDVERVRAAIALPTIIVQTTAVDRAAYLRDPGLGRKLSTSTPALPRGDFDAAFVVADGLSVFAVHNHAAEVVRLLAAGLAGWKIAPVVIAHQARVAIGDPIGQALGARLVVVLIGERPGLSAADSLGAYVTWGPQPGRRDNERNCVSNIHAPDGLSCAQAADKIVWLLTEARRLGFTGVDLKDRQTATTELNNLSAPRSVRQVLSG